MCNLHAKILNQRLDKKGNMWAYIPSTMFRRMGQKKYELPYLSKRFQQKLNRQVKQIFDSRYSRSSFSKRMIKKKVCNNHYQFTNQAKVE